MAAHDVGLLEAHQGGVQHSVGGGRGTTGGFGSFGGGFGSSGGRGQQLYDGAGAVR